MRPTLFAFDLDGTLCEGGGLVGHEILSALDALALMAVVSGASDERIRSAFGGQAACWRLSQSGNVCVDPAGAEIWRQNLNEAERREIMAHIAQYSGEVDDRGCQISVSLVGHRAPPEIKSRFDPKQVIRRAILTAVPFDGRLTEVRIGGTTCLDYTRRGATKGRNLKALMARLGANCIYFGDALYPGGNDESVIGVCETVPVSGPADTLAKLSARLEKAAA